MDRKNIEKIAQTADDRMLLAKVWDKINTGIPRDVPAYSCFLSPRELELTRLLFGEPDGLLRFGGYPNAQRQMLCYLPEYLSQDSLMEEDSPVVCLRATYHSGDKLSHRDFLGSLMGSGVARESVGDICVGDGSCDFFATKEIAPYLLSSFDSAGRTKLHLQQIPLAQASIPQPQIRPIRDTLASLRLDAVIGLGFQVARGPASACVTSGKVTVNGLPCIKPDRAIAPGDVIAVRGSGKIKLEECSGQTKKGRIGVLIHRYV